MATSTLEEVFVSVSCGRLHSSNFAAHADIEGGVVRADDIDRLMAGGARLRRARGPHADTPQPHRLPPRRRCRVQRSARHGGPRAFRRPAHGHRRRGAGAQPACSSSSAATSRSRGLVATPYASALAATSEEERRLGVTCIDIGGGTTDVAVFVEDHFVYADCRAGRRPPHHLRYRPHALQTPLAEAERIKALYGTMVGAQSDEHEAFSYALAGEEEGARGHATKAQLPQSSGRGWQDIVGLCASGWSEAGVVPMPASESC